MASEARSLITDLFVINKLYMDLKDSNYDDPKDLIKKFKEFNSLKYNITAKILFIKNSMNLRKNESSINGFISVMNLISDNFKPYLNSKDDNIHNYAMHKVYSVNDNTGITDFQDKFVEFLELSKNIATYKLVK